MGSEKAVWESGVDSPFHYRRIFTSEVLVKGSRSFPISDFGPGLPLAVSRSSVSFLDSGPDRLFSISPPGEGKVPWTGQTQPYSPGRFKMRPYRVPLREARSLNK